MPVGGQTKEQSPLEQSMLQGAVVHWPAHPPFEHEQLLFVHCAAGRAGAPASRVSGMGGPPFGVLASGTFVPEPPQPMHKPSSAIA